MEITNLEDVFVQEPDAIADEPQAELQERMELHQLAKALRLALVPVGSTVRHRTST
jgi:hypothetical protein